MNPTSASLPTAPGRLATAAPQPAVSAPQESNAAQPAPNIVTSIPVHNQTAAAAPANEDDELDKIMQDVGREMNKAEKPRKAGLLSFLHKPKANKNPAKPVAMAAPAAIQQPVAAPQPVQAAPIAQPAIPLPTPAQPRPERQAQAKVKTQRQVPVFVIFVALCVTGFLVAAAIAAYK